MCGPIVDRGLVLWIGRAMIVTRTSVPSRTFRACHFAGQPARVPQTRGGSDVSFCRFVHRRRSAARRVGGRRWVARSASPLAVEPDGLGWRLRDGEVEAVLAEHALRRRRRPAASAVTASPCPPACPTTCDRTTRPRRPAAARGPADSARSGLAGAAGARPAVSGPVRSAPSRPPGPNRGVRRAPEATMEPGLRVRGPRRGGPAWRPPAWRPRLASEVAGDLRCGRDHGRWEARSTRRPGA